jgi:hypothetical protein
MLHNSKTCIIFDLSKRKDMTPTKIKAAITSNTWFTLNGSSKVEIPNTAVLNMYEGSKLNGYCTKKFGFYAIETANGGYAIKILHELYTTSK